MAKNDNSSLGSAKRRKNDEFYTRIEDIQEEVSHYKKHFHDQTVLCNCDDPRVSNFFHYFSHQFETLGLKRLIATCYKNQNMDRFSQQVTEKAIWLEYLGDKNGNRIPDPEEIGIHLFQGDGDFRSSECIELLKQADIVVTNPPFSLFREYVAQLVQYGKKFLIIGNKNAITYKEIFPLIQLNRLWVGAMPMSREIYFDVPQRFIEEALAQGKDRTVVKVNGRYMARSQSIWFTNLDHNKRHEELILWKHYTPEEYPHYDNYDAIDIAKTSDIPCDYDGLMGVPLTFLDKYNPDQFEIVGDDVSLGVSKGRFYVKGKRLYSRIVIRRKQQGSAK